jgi:hypothetical protein
MVASLANLASQDVLISSMKSAKDVHFFRCKWDPWNCSFAQTILLKTEDPEHLKIDLLLPWLKSWWWCVHHSCFVLFCFVESRSGERRNQCLQKSLLYPTSLCYFPRQTWILLILLGHNLWDKPHDAKPPKWKFNHANITVISVVNCHTKWLWAKENVILWYFCTNVLIIFGAKTSQTHSPRPSHHSRDCSRLHHKPHQNHLFEFTLLDLRHWWK